MTIATLPPAESPAHAQRPHIDDIQVLSGEMPTVTPLLPAHLEPYAMQGYTNYYYPLPPNEKEIVEKSIDSIVGLNKHNALTEGVPGFRIVSRGAALQGSEYDPANQRDECNVRILFDEQRGLGVLANAIEHPAAAATVTQAFHRATKRARLNKYSTPKEVETALLKSTEHIERALEEVKDTLTDPENPDGANYQEMSTSMTGFQLLEQGRLALTHAGDTALYIYGPDGTCVKQTRTDVSYGDEDGARLTNAFTGDAGDNPLESHEEDQRTVIQLQPGRNVLVLTSGSVADREITTTEQAHYIAQTIEGLGLELDGENTATMIATQLVQNRGETKSDAGVIVLTIDVDPWKDLRPAWRQWTDKIRPSTLGYAALVRGQLHSAQLRRQLYEEASQRGRAGRVLARSADVVGTPIGALLLYLATRSALVAMGIGHPSSASPNAYASGNVEAYHQAASSVDPNLVGAGAGNHTVTDPSLTGAESTPVDTAHNTAPTETAASAATAGAAATIHFEQTQTALHTDPLSHRAANVTDWSQQSIAKYGKLAGMSDSDVGLLRDDQSVLDTLNQAFYNNNSSVAQHPQHWLMAGIEYDKAGQNKAAYDQAIAWQKAHGHSVPNATDVVQKPPTKPGPASTPTTGTGHSPATQTAAEQNAFEKLTGNTGLMLKIGGGVLSMAAAVGAAFGIRTVVRRQQARREDNPTGEDNPKAALGILAAMRRQRTRREKNSEEETKPAGEDNPTRIGKLFRRRRPDKYSGKHTSKHPATTPNAETAETAPVDETTEKVGAIPLTTRRQQAEKGFFDAGAT